jgi:hypothetical protein
VLVDAPPVPDAAAPFGTAVAPPLVAASTPLPRLGTASPETIAVQPANSETLPSNDAKNAQEPGDFWLFCIEVVRTCRKVARGTRDQTTNRQALPDSDYGRLNRRNADVLSVAIALEPPIEPARAVVVADSCEASLGKGRCRVADELRPGGVVAWYALVQSDEGSNQLRIEFRDRSANGTVIETRELALPQAGDEQRWASVGAVIAAFVAARDPGGEAERPRPVALPPPIAAPPPAPSVAYNADLALLAGPGLDRGRYRLGALVRGYVASAEVPRVLGLVSLRYAERPGALSLAWWGASCGMGARFGGRSSIWSAELTGELAFERLRITASDDATGKSEATSQNRFGGRLSINTALALVSYLGVVVGAEATALRPSVAIAVGDGAAGRALPVSYAFSAGLRFSSE